MALGDNSVLDRLNSAERDILVLLSQGHTAKSVAALRDVSVAAVNERLRSARRKTGVGSSRELARLVSPRENLDDLIGLATATAVGQSDLHPDAAPPRRASPFRRWSPPVIATALVAAALAAALFIPQTAVPPSGRGQPLVSTLISEQQRAPDMIALHAEAVRPADSTWSPGAEALLQQRYQAVIGDADGMESFGIVCSATLCEVAGETRLDVASAQVADLLGRLQSLAAGSSIEGLHHEFGHYGSNPSRPRSFVFVAYWRRT